METEAKLNNYVSRKLGTNSMAAKPPGNGLFSFPLFSLESYSLLPLFLFLYLSRWPDFPVRYHHARSILPILASAPIYLVQAIHSDTLAFSQTQSENKRKRFRLTSWDWVPISGAVTRAKGYWVLYCTLALEAHLYGYGPVLSQVKIGHRLSHCIAITCLSVSLFC